MNRNRARKTAVLSLAAMMAFGSMSASAVEIKTFPEGPVSYLEETVEKTGNTLQTVFSGAYETQVEMEDNSTRNAVMYIAEGYSQYQPFITIVPATGMTADDVLEKGGWKQIADENDLLLMILEAPEEGYDQSVDGADYAYLQAAAGTAAKQDYWKKGKGSNYMVAYGDAAGLATQFIEANLPGAWAGLVTFGDMEIGAADITNEKGTELPVWMFVDELDKESELVDLFKANNGCTDEAFSNENADYIYFPNQKVNELLLDNQPMSQVRVTVTENSGEPDADRSAAAYDFLKDGSRMVGVGDPKMGYARNLEDWGVTDETVEIDGVTRHYYQYVPTTLRETSEGKAPLLVALHGGGLNGAYFLERTQLVRLAEERGFIVVFPTGTLGKGISPTWNNTCDDTLLDDVSYLQAIVDTVSEELPVDVSRRYVYGHSMGCLMSFTTTFYMNGTFAAAAGSGAASTDAYPEMDGQLETPIYLMLGENDNDDASLKTGEKLQGFLDLFAGRNNVGTKDDIDGAYRTGIYTTYVWDNDEGEPMLQYTHVDGMPHTSTLDLLDNMYTWLSQWSRNDDGSVEYQGNLLED